MRRSTYFRLVPNYANQSHMQLTLHLHCCLINTKTTVASVQDTGPAMIVCSCNVFSDQQVREVVSAGAGARNTSDVYRGLGCAPQCGRCARTIRNIMNDVQAQSSCQSCPQDCPAAGGATLIAAE
ncbi:(2Fe-2S)-binding protein [Xanthobacter sp. TB0139]|uniref:(2Fe-2S)-binding protein n=1 Tax=Xanthobacter sp. TB0139 TaxID=3459178 RepID=UPI00403A556F